MKRSTKYLKVEEQEFCSKPKLGINPSSFVYCLTKIGHLVSDSVYFKMGVLVTTSKLLCELNQIQCEVFLTHCLEYDRYSINNTCGYVDGGNG